MIILTDQDCFNQYIYNNVDKIYEFKLLLGIKTDTHDILGLITENSNSCINVDNIYNTIYKLKGIVNQEYPLFSSKRYNGKPLWYYGKNNLSHLITEYPKHKIEIKKIKIKDNYTISKSLLLNCVNININKLCKSKQFRQNEVLKRWNEIKDTSYQIIDIEVMVIWYIYKRYK